MRRTGTAIIAILVVSCTQAPLNSEDTSAAPRSGSNTAAPGTQQGDSAAIDKLEQEANAIAKTNGCSSSGDCRTAPVGSRACWGPRYYLPYCARSTDSAALFSKLEEVAAAEKAYDSKYHIMSTCEFRMAPAVESVAGVCTVK